MQSVWYTVSHVHSKDTIETIFNEFIVHMDVELTEEIGKILQRLDGDAALAVDGVTINRRSYLLYTLSKGSKAIFLKSSHLGELVHATDAEVADIVKTLEFCYTEFNWMSSLQHHVRHYIVKSNS